MEKLIYYIPGTKERTQGGGLATCSFFHLQCSKGRVLLRFFLLKVDVSAHLGQGVKYVTHICLFAFSANCDELPKVRSPPLAGTAMKQPKKRLSEEASRYSNRC